MLLARRRVATTARLKRESATGVDGFCMRWLGLPAAGASRMHERTARRASRCEAGSITGPVEHDGSSACTACEARHHRHTGVTVTARVVDGQNGSLFLFWEEREGFGIPRYRMETP